MRQTKLTEYGFVIDPKQTKLTEYFDLYPKDKKQSRISEWTSAVRQRWLI